MLEKRLFDYLYEQLDSYPLERAFGHRDPGGQWQYRSTRETVSLVNRLSTGLLRLGLRPGDKVASAVYRTSPDWVVLDYALLQIGVLHVPMYPTIGPRDYQYILDECEAQYCFVGEGDLYEKVAAVQAGLPALKEIFTFYDHAAARRWDTLLGEDADAETAELDRIKAAIRPDDLATLVYTSGTTGHPKGVMLSHRNIVFNVESLRGLLPFGPGDRCLSFLPVSHVFERAAVYVYTAYGASVSFVGMDNLGGEDGDLKAVQPHFFAAVPRLLEKVYERILDKGLELRGLKRGLFFWALRLTDDWDFDQQPGPWLRLKRRLADALVFSKWRAALGGQVKGLFVGASACPVKIMRTFNAAGISVREGYGLTEAAPAISVNTYGPYGAMLGSVGEPIEGLTLQIEGGPDFRPGEGEIVIASPGVMLGYYKQPEKTAEMIREKDGRRWLYTGDVGMLVPGRRGHQFLKITDRKKELLKTSGGKYVAPTPIEAMLKEHRLVEHAMVVGDDRKFVSVVIVPAEPALRAWCAQHGIPWTSLEEMLANPQVKARFDQLLERINPHFNHHEQLRKFALVPGPWEPAKPDGTPGELTPTLKLKRRVILEKYGKQIGEMYGA